MVHKRKKFILVKSIGKKEKRWQIYAVPIEGKPFLMSDIRFRSRKNAMDYAKGYSKMGIKMKVSS